MIHGFDPVAGTGRRGQVKVLVAEDERKIAAMVRKGLEAAGFVVDVCHDGNDALALVGTHPFDALVLDILLPGRDGLSVLRLLRERRNPVPVLLLTARSSPGERVEGLNLGADDYVAKPFYTDELVARLHAILRRHAGDPVSVLRAGEVMVNLLTREATVHGRAVELTTREFALLTCLLRSPGRVFTRTQICEQVWNYHHDPGTNLVDVYIQRLRRKLEDVGERPLVETVRGVGYRLARATAHSP
jgi:two-component system OmpR family response regulator